MMAAAIFVLALVGAPDRPAAEEDRPKVRPKPGRAIITVMNEVIERHLPGLLASPAPEARRVSVKNGLFAIGAWSPPGGEGYGVMAPPLQLFPRAGLGQSLNVDPITGRSYFGPP